MANCLRCGKPLEKDGFCMNCMDFTLDEDIQKTCDSNGIPDQTKPYADDYARIYMNAQNQQPDMTSENAMQSKSEKVSRSILIRRVLAYFVMGAGLCVIGICILLNLFGESKKSDKYVYSDMDSYTNNKVYSNNLDDQEESVTGDIEEDDSTIYEADYDEIMKTGEPSNIYNLFSALKSEVAPVMEQYFKEQGVNPAFSSDMSNTYVIVDGEKYTDYRSYSIWAFGEDQKDQYILFYDTVTGQLLHVDINVENKDKAIDLVEKSLVAIDPGLSAFDVDQVCDVLKKSEDNVDEHCNEFEIYGTYDKSTNLYTYIIESNVDNRK